MFAKMAPFFIVGDNFSISCKQTQNFKEKTCYERIQQQKLGCPRKSNKQFALIHARISFSSRETKQCENCENVPSPFSFFTKIT